MVGRKAHRLWRLLKNPTTCVTISSYQQEPMLRASYAPMLTDQDQLIFETLVPPVVSLSLRDEILSAKYHKM
jgi:hypothetical protein